MNQDFIKTTLAFAILLIGTFIFSSCSSEQKNENNTLMNVSYDPTREFYSNYNHIFMKHWKEMTGKDVKIMQFHGGSGKQALEVVNGLEADVVTLALEYDVNIVRNAGLIEDDWVKEFPHNSAPYTSTIVFLVRKGNPKKIKDWGDLVKDSIGIITPNPKTSGGARWNYLAAWAYAEKLFNGDEAQIKGFMKKLYQNVLDLASGARSSTNKFIENQLGDVLLSWENEAYLSIKDYPNDYEIVMPSVSILAEPSVAIVDKIVNKRNTRKLATEYLNYLYSDEAQHVAAKHHYRPTNKTILDEYKDFDQNVKLITIDHFGGWDKAQKTHFADGGLFDQIYEKK
ncbi:MAG: sulfate ABC transporter substrate-binding protein [Fibrobacter sp.]|uniref:sulfate ABC transporter substrate-binding protein n=1 Tax=Fibrobacter sp. TaxID=35828 RepID=UPI0025C20405|nr:sulfate ABC transporter substrate-binding protein [Fibrobacter sp.]MBQ7081489.1 sulfate ABC transporter substrate-binding protein [Fibrobacter sp.]